LRAAKHEVKLRMFKHQLQLTHTAGQVLFAICNMQLHLHCHSTLFPSPLYRTTWSCHITKDTHYYSYIKQTVPASITYT